jgi:hypothetical protein
VLTTVQHLLRCYVVSALQVEEAINSVLNDRSFPDRKRFIDQINIVPLDGGFQVFILWRYVIIDASMTTES